MPVDDLPVRDPGLEEELASCEVTQCELLDLRFDLSGSSTGPTNGWISANPASHRARIASRLPAADDGRRGLGAGVERGEEPCELHHVVVRHVMFDDERRESARASGIRRMTTR